MKSICFLIFGLTMIAHPGWLTNMVEAQKIASEKHQPILLNFSGSDWCGPCIRMEKDFFEAASFKAYAAEHLVLLNADFPRNKKNKLAENQLKHNEKLAEQYNNEGKFPLTLLLDAEGKVLKRWEGCPDTNPETFIKEIAVFTGSSN
ncbi:MAG: thioredoxin family protein [Sphingobacteriales bacterium]|nr:thioredoxin family protein [Sphingobacteriales bacterium]